MKRLVTLIAALALVLSWGCGGKKKKEAASAPVQEYKFELGACPVDHITVTPERSEDPACTLGSNCTMDLTATAYNAEGHQLDVPLSWSFRYNDYGNEKSVGGGHVLEVANNRQARFVGSGYAAGEFAVLVQDRDCNMGTDKEPQYPEGEAWITVFENPDSEVMCGRMRVTYGARVDRMGDEVIASAKVLLLAEISAKEKLGHNYRVIFYLNGKPFPSKRPLFRDPRTPLEDGMTVGHIGVLPLYITPGSYKVNYELKYKGDTVCGSKAVDFRAR